VQAGAAIQVDDAAGVVREAGRLLRDRPAMERMGRAGLAFCSAHRGATARALELITLNEKRETRNE